MSSRAFEREFLIRETGMARGDAEGWLAGRRLAIPVIACSAAAAVAWSAGVPVLASILASIAAVSLWVGARRMESSDGAERGATTHAASTLLGLCVWGIEGWLFVSVIVCAVN